MRREKVAAGAILIAALAWGWLAVATAVYCEMAGKMGFFRFPYHQWLIAVPYYAANWYMALCVVISAAVPTAAVGLVAFAAIKMRRRKSAKPVYGKTAWATRDEMASGNISRKPRDA
jgi:hypothetical protein